MKDLFTEKSVKLGDISLIYIILYVFILFILFIDLTLKLNVSIRPNPVLEF